VRDSVSFAVHIVPMRRALTLLDRVGSVGALIAAIAAPCCFPLFAALSAAVGLGALGQYETVVLYAFQGFALLSLIGLAFAVLRHRHFGPLVLGLLSVALLVYTFYYAFGAPTLYAGLFGLLAATIWNYFCSRSPRMQQPILRSVITCPLCGHQAEEIMPTNACLFFYDCTACHAQLKPAIGNCCVFCSYGSVPCPPIQTGASCCV
jgi:MerC mercury resistance protein